MQVLIIEDEQRLVRLMRRVLEEDHYVVDGRCSRQLCAAARHQLPQQGIIASRVPSELTAQTLASNLKLIL